MKADKLDAFPIPLYILNIADQTKDMNRGLVKEIEEYGHHQQRTGIGVDQTRSGMEEHHYFFMQLQSIISDVATQVLGRKTSAESFWANSINESGYHMPHSHRIGNYMWNGVYFPCGDSDWHYESSSTPREGSLVLLDPLEFVKQGVADDKTDRWPYWGNPVCVAPKEGTLVIFPVYLPHMVTPTTRPRKSVAFYLRFD
jgi:hypothetical protein